MYNNLNFNKELYRKSYHLLALIIPYLYFHYGYFNFIIFLFTFTIITLLFDVLRLYTKPLFKVYNFLFLKVSRTYELTGLMSSTLMLISFCFITLFFNFKIVLAAMIITAVSDAFAAIFGFAMIWHMWLPALFAIVAIIITIFVKSCNLDTDYYVKAAEVEAIENEHFAEYKS